jgi:hypothetical protein
MSRAGSRRAMGCAQPCGRPPPSSRSGAPASTTPAPPELKRAFEMWADAMQQGSSDGRSFIEWLGDGQKVSVAAEALQLVLGRGRHTKEALLFAALERAGTAVPLVRAGAALRERLRTRLGELLLDDTHVILSPVFPVVAFPTAAAPATRRPSSTPACGTSSSSRRRRCPSASTARAFLLAVRSSVAAAPTASPSRWRACSSAFWAGGSRPGSAEHLHLRSAQQR